LIGIWLGDVNLAGQLDMHIIVTCLSAMCETKCEFKGLKQSEWQVGSRGQNRMRGFRGWNVGSKIGTRLVGSEVKTIKCVVSKIERRRLGFRGWNEHIV